MVPPIQLEPLSDTRLDPRPHSGLLTLNPSIELFAWAAGPDSLQIWRTNGQVVVKSHQRGDEDSVEALRWKPDGESTARQCELVADQIQASSWRWAGAMAWCD
jgi:anaphase-promoting complex subunit 4